MTQYPPPTSAIHPTVGGDAIHGLGIGIAVTCRQICGGGQVVNRLDGRVGPPFGGRAGRGPLMSESGFSRRWRRAQMAIGSKSGRPVRP